MNRSTTNRNLSTLSSAMRMTHIYNANAVGGNSEHVNMVATSTA